MATAELSGGLRSLNANQRRDADRPHLEGPGRGAGVETTFSCAQDVQKTRRKISESLSEKNDS